MGARADEDVDPSVELARWLVEAGHRRGRVHRLPEPVLRPPSRRSPFLRPYLFVVLGVAIWQYLYVDTQLEILSLHSLIVFILAGHA